MGIKGPQSETGSLEEAKKLKQHSSLVTLQSTPVPYGGTGTINPIKRWPINTQNALLIASTEGPITTPNSSTTNGVQVGQVPVNKVTGQERLEFFIMAEASPVIVTVRADMTNVYANNLGTVGQPNFNFFVDAAFDPQPDLVVASDGTAFTGPRYIPQGAVLHGKVAATGVRVRGFSYTAALPTLGTGQVYRSIGGLPPVFAPVSVWNRVSVEFHGLAASVNGFIPSIGATDADKGGALLERTVTPVFLNASDYTVELANNRNLFLVDNSAYRVVGLYGVLGLLT